MGTQYEPLPLSKGSELRAPILKVVCNDGLTVLDGFTIRCPY